MTERYHDGFEHLALGQSAGTVEQMLSDAGWYIRRDNLGGTPNVASPGVYGFGNCLQISGTVGIGAGGYHIVHPLDAEGGITTATGFFGVDVLIPAVSNAAFVWIGLYDGVSDAPQVTVQFCPNGVMRAYRGYPNGGALLDTTKVGAYLLDTWFRLELGAFIDPAAGWFEGRVNTVRVFRAVSQNTKNTGNSYIDSIAAGCQSQGGVQVFFALFIDNANVNDDQGAQNNTWLGKVRVKSGLMVAAGASTMFTPVGAGANYQAVNNLVRGDSKYVADGTVNDFDLYAPDPNLGSQPVRALQLRAAVRQDDATQRVYRNVLKMGGTTITGRDHYTNQTYSDWLDMFELNPATGIGMVGTDVNGSWMGPKVEV
jgi:hypothetical protein